MLLVDRHVRLATYKSSDSVGLLIRFFSWTIYLEPRPTKQRNDYPCTKDLRSEGSVPNKPVFSFVNLSTLNLNGNEGNEKQILHFMDLGCSIHQDSPRALVFQRILWQFPIIS